MLEIVEQYLSPILAQLAPNAVEGMLLAAAVVAFSRLPLLSIPAMVAALACLGAFIAAGGSGEEAGMAVAVAGSIAGLILLLSGGQLWQRPSLGLRRFLPQAQPEDGGQKTGGDLQAAVSLRASVSATLRAALLHLAGCTPSFLFRLVSVAALALAAETLAHSLALPVSAQEQRLGLWLALMGGFAALSTANALISATGFVLLLAAAELLVADIVSDLALQPTVFGAIAVLIIVAALGFSFAARLRHSNS